MFGSCRQAKYSNGKIHKCNKVLLHMIRSQYLWEDFILEPSSRRLLCAHSHSRIWLFANPWTVARQAPLSTGFFRQEYCSGLSCPPPGDLPGPRTEPASLTSPALGGRLFPTSTTWEAYELVLGHKKEWNNAICSNMDGPRDYHTVAERRTPSRAQEWALV